MSPSVLAKLGLAAGLAVAAIGAAPQQAGPIDANRIGAEPIGGEPAVDITDWGTLGDMIEPVWVTQGLPVQRVTLTAWLVPGKVLILRHGTTDRMKLGVKFADIVQRIELNPATGKFEILYSYEDGRTLRAVGQIEPDGTFAETLTTADGSPQRNLYRLDTPRKMRIVRQRRAGDGWTDASFAVKVGETPGERIARENEERRQREMLAAAERDRQEREEARRQAEQEAQWAEEEAEREEQDAEQAAQRQRSWQMFQDDMQGIVRKQQQDIEDSRRFRERIEADVARGQEQRRQREEESQRSSTPAPRAPSPGIILAPQQRAPQPRAPVISSPRPVAPTSPPVQRVTSPVGSQPVTTPPPAPRKMCTAPARANSTGRMGTKNLADTRAQLQSMLRTWCGGKAAQVTNMSCKVSTGTAENGISMCDADYVCPGYTYACPGARQE